jgi:hypothetical protein
MGIVFSNHEEAELWLDGKPKRSLVAIGFRTVLRSAPLLFSDVPLVSGDDHGTYRILSAFRILLCIGCYLAKAIDAPKSNSILTSARPKLSYQMKKMERTSGRWIAISTRQLADLSLNKYELPVTSTRLVSILSTASNTPYKNPNNDHNPLRNSLFMAAGSDAHRLMAVDFLVDRSVFEQPLWEAINQPDNIDVGIFFENLEYSSFWKDWYQGFLDGKPMDWELQRRVALIDDAIWEAGPEAVAEEIERIRSKYALEQEIRELKTRLAEVVTITKAP